MMAEIMQEPMLTLATMEEVRAAIDTNARKVWDSTLRWRVKSLWLIGLIDEVVASGEYPYNATIKKLAEQRLGLPPKLEREYSQEGDTLSLLIYNAQGYRRSDRLVAQGYRPCSQEMIEEAHRTGRKLELPGGTLLTVREVEGKLYAFKPRMRRYAVAVQGNPARLQEVECPECGRMEHSCCCGYCAAVERALAE